MTTTAPLLYVRITMLDVAYEAHGPLDGTPVILLHGFPYDPRGYDAIAPVLAERGYRVLVPYLRGYGPTRFINEQVMRSGQQAALAKDLLEFMDVLSIPQATLAGYDWGGRAACIVAALWPQRVRGLVTGDGYNIQAIANAVAGYAPRQIPDIPKACRLSGLEPFTIDRSSLFVNVGERTNITGSARHCPRCCWPGDCSGCWGAGQKRPSTLCERASRDAGDAVFK